MLRQRVCLTGLAAIAAASTFAASASALPASFVGSARYNTNASSYVIMRARFYNKKRDQFIAKREWNISDFVTFIDRNEEPLNGV